MMILPSFSGLTRPVGPTYTAPLVGRSDLAYIYGLRKLVDGYTGNGLKLRRSSDNAEQYFGFGANGEISVAAALSWGGSSNLSSVELIEQGGSGNYIRQTTGSKQPFFAIAGVQCTGLNGKAALRFDETLGHAMVNPTNYATPQSATIFTVAGRRTMNDFGSMYQLGFFNQVDFYFNPVANRFQFDLYDQSGSNIVAELFSSINATALWQRARFDHVAKTYTAKFKAASSTTTKTGTFTGTRSASSNQLHVGCRNSLYYLSMDWHELMILNADSGATDFGSIESNVETFFSI